MNFPISLSYSATGSMTLRYTALSKATQPQPKPRSFYVRLQYREITYLSGYRLSCCCEKLSFHVYASFLWKGWKYWFLIALSMPDTHVVVLLAVCDAQEE